MNWKRTILFILLALFAVLLIKVDSFQKKNPSGVSSEAHQDKIGAGIPEKKVLPLLEGEAVTVFQFENGATHEKMKCRFEGKEWILEAPVQAPVLSHVLDQWIALLATLDRRRSFTVHEKAGLREYGFDQPLFRICVATSKVSRERCLNLSSQASLNGDNYAAWEDEKEVFFVDPGLKEAFQNKTVYQLRRKQIFPYALRDAYAVLISWDDMRIEAKKENGEWKLVNQRENPLKTDDLYLLLGALNQLYVREFFDFASFEDKKFGFSSDQKRIIQIDFSDGQVEKLAIGNEDASVHGYYGAAHEFPGVFLVSKRKMDEIVTLARQLESKNAVSENKGVIKSL